jgi:flagellar hook-length control protein FliK
LKPATTAPASQPAVQTAVQASVPELVQSSDLVQQITSVFSKLVDDPAVVTEPQGLRSQAPAGQVPLLRVLNLVLKPEELGQVAIKMKLSGQSLSVEVIAEKSSTHRLLETEARKLAEHIISGGYELEQLSIQQQMLPAATATKDGSPVGRPVEPANYPQGGPQAGQSQQEGHARRNEHGRPSDANAPRSGEAVSDLAHSASLPRSGIYL